jgi:hypothetical protein
LHVVCPSQGSLRGALKPHGSKTPPYSERPISAAGKARIGAAARPCVRKVGLRRASKHHSQCDKSYLLAVIWSRIPSPRDMWARYRQLKAAGLPTGRAKKPAATPRRRKLPLLTIIDHNCTGAAASQPNRGFLESPHALCTCLLAVVQTI